MSNIMIKDLNDSKELNNEEMSKVSGGYTPIGYTSINKSTLYDKTSSPKLSWSWSLSSTNNFKLMGF